MRSPAITQLKQKDPATDPGCVQTYLDHPRSSSNACNLHLWLCHSREAFTGHRSQQCLPEFSMMRKCSNRTHILAVQNIHQMEHKYVSYCLLHATHGTGLRHVSPWIWIYIYILILTCAYFVCFMDFWNHLSPPTCAAGPSSAHHASTVPHIVVHLLLGPLMLWLVLFLFPSLPSLCFSRSISLAPTPSVLPQGVNQKHQRSIATKAVHLVDKKYKNVPTLGVPKIPKADNCSGLSTRSMARRSPTHRRTICP